MTKLTKEKLHLQGRRELQRKEHKLPIPQNIVKFAYLLYVQQLGVLSRAGSEEKGLEMI